MASDVLFDARFAQICPISFDIGNPVASLQLHRYHQATERATPTVIKSSSIIPIIYQVLLFVYATVALVPPARRQDLPLQHRRSWGFHFRITLGS